MKKIILFLIPLFVLSSPVLAIGPVPISAWYGAGVGSAGITFNFGADIGINIPTIPTFYIESDNSAGIIPLGFINTGIGVARTGIGYKFNIFGDNLKLRLSAGSANVTSSTVIPWGSGTINATNAGAYVTTAAEASLFGLGGMAKISATSIPAGTLTEIVFCLTVNI